MGVCRLEFFSRVFSVNSVAELVFAVDSRMNRYFFNFSRQMEYLLNIWGMMKHRPEGFLEKHG